MTKKKKKIQFVGRELHMFKIFKYMFIQKINKYKWIKEKKNHTHIQ